jgi:hypothetical protein
MLSSVVGARLPADACLVEISQAQDLVSIKVEIALIRRT